ncbi:HpcH/HpaI aldolase/citrate lyase family protein [Nonomuraea sp. NPDC050556]|uniref:HpcH/HpaI aldolase/citrate lyase family protein n=1 Tax=Nonomuraea sp. NPDC050556 TaxID=3364369 RepID=UPI0037B39419
MSAPLTWLYVPGDRPERFSKAVDSGADVVIIDLEDAVAEADKERALRNAVAFLKDGAGKVPVHVRVNDLATARGMADLRALADAPGLDAVRLPKVEAAHTLDLLVDVFAGRPVSAYALLESARGVARAQEIAAHPRVAGIALGEQDLAAELGISDEFAFAYLRMQAVVAAAAAGLPGVPMSVYANVRDDEGLAASCLRGRALGLFGRTAIHPRQIPVIRRAFRPSDEEVARAREVVGASSGRGAVALADGRFVDAPIVARAQAVLRLAEELSDEA